MPLSRLAQSSEVAAGAVAVPIALLLVAYPHLLPDLMPVLAALLLGAVVWIAIVDTKSFLIPDGPLVVIALVGSAMRVAAALGQGSAGEAFLWVILDAALWGGCLLALREIYFRRTGIDGIGFGDVKLAAAGAMLVTAAGFATALLAASVSALAIVLFARLRRHAHQPDRLPFGAFLAPACWLVWILSV